VDGKFLSVVSVSRGVIRSNTLTRVIDGNRRSEHRNKGIKVHGVQPILYSTKSYLKRPRFPPIRYKILRVEFNII